ncbi:hypothetical protein TBK1r_39440 [Stieleria magnilauensis]|uniref:Uncharacterized protein n=1 Tax=Stieleria magnilauensis TaxID=2527963 RepID=A0ABX5XTR7_9BACT|nr:hypothetical protein TBK1r_39440 [Planctomycetes bacterium TBK1r]
MIAEANDVFFDTDGFAETVVYWPLGVAANAFEVDAIVDWSDEEGSNQVRGDGRGSLNAEKGRIVRSSAVIEFPTHRIDETGNCVPMVISSSGKDRVLVSEHDRTIKLNVKRIIGHDAAVQSVLCTRQTEHQASHAVGRRG